jgi:rhodanese-related sulfurtransferase
MRRIARYFLLPAVLILSITLIGCTYVTGAIPETSTQSSSSAVRNVSPEEAKSLFILSSKFFSLVDVRTPGEYAAGHIDSAINIDYYSPGFREQVDRLNKNGAYLVYCQTGVRSAAAADIMAGLGFKDIYNMTGGFSAWEAAGLPVEK